MPDIEAQVQAAQAQSQAHSGGRNILSNIPIPDPTTLTWVAVRESTKVLRELLEERLDGMDKAIELVAQAAGRIPSAAQIDIENLRLLTFEKFVGIDMRLKEQEARINRQENDSKESVRVAFEAADKAITKNEGAMIKTETFLVKQIDQLFLATGNNANRVQVLESVKAGAAEIKTDKRADNTLVIAAIGVATAIMVAVIAWNHTTPTPTAYAPPVGPTYSAPVPTAPVPTK